MIPVSTSTQCTGGRRNTIRSLSGSLTRTSIPPRYSCVARRLLSSTTSPVPTGRSTLCRKLRFRHRCPFEPPTRSKRTICGPPPCHPSYSQSICHPRRDSHRPTRPGRPTEQNHRRRLSHVRESPDLPALRIHRNAGEAMDKPIFAESGRVDYRSL